MGLNNVYHNAGAKRDGAGLHRSKDPGAGAFSHYHDFPTVATQPIKAGSELFVDYGEKWFRDREHSMGVVPFQDDFDQADIILEDFLTEQMILGKEGKWDNLSNDQQQSHWDHIRDSADERVKIALPRKIEDLDLASEIGTARYSVPDFVRSPEWLRENAMCADNIRPGDSIIPQAGRGAFAKRFMPKGSLVAPAPVLHLHRDVMKLETQQKYASKRHKGWQLLLNYSFGHRKSSVLLLPYGPAANYINHNGKDPNAEIRWSDSHLHHTDWLKLSEKALMKKKFGLMMEFIALRDIEPGEEVTIDYGKEWEDAWNKHVVEWIPEENSQSYMSAAELKAEVLDIRTESEQEEFPYPSNVHTACYYNNCGVEESARYEDDEGATVVEMEYRADGKWVRPCKILSKHEDAKEVWYTAEMVNFGQMHDDCKISEGEKLHYINIPQEGLTFIDLEYTADMHMRSAFRHEMMIADDMFPSAWKEIH